MSWADAYVGLPWADRGRDRAGCDCYGLARLIYADQLGIDIPSYAGAYACAAERAEVAALLDDATATGPWRRVCVVAPFDILLFRRGRLRSHVGVAVDGGRMLHMEGGGQACIVRTAEPRWKSRFNGAWRHLQAPVNAHGS